ncbi:MAG: serine hydrolase [bacterium]
MFYKSLPRLWLIHKNWCIVFVCLCWSTTTLCSLSITQRIEKISKSIPGTFGVAALHIESNKKIAFNGNVRFPMASTYKIPIALYCLSLVDQEKRTLQSQKIITPYDLRRFCFLKPNQCVSLATLIQLMIEKSDNAASDLILKIVGGPHAVTQWLEAHGFNDMSIDRSTLKMIADFSGVPEFDENRCTVQRDCKQISNVSQQKHSQAIEKFYEDQQDTTTPCTMVNFLALLHHKKLASTHSTNFLLNSMLKCKWGKNSIKRLLPRKTKVWHKTGRMNGIVADVGIVKLPRGKGHLALAIYTNKSMIYRKKRTYGIARIAKELFNYFSYPQQTHRTHTKCRGKKIRHPRKGKQIRRLRKG